MGYQPIPEDQWTEDDLDRAYAAKDFDAINKARKAGQLHDVLQAPAPEPLPVGPTVPGQVPGSPS